MMLNSAGVLCYFIKDQLHIEKKLWDYLVLIHMLLRVFQNTKFSSAEVTLHEKNDIYRIVCV